MADEPGLTGSWEQTPRRRPGRTVVVGLGLLAVLALAFGARVGDEEGDGFAIEPADGDEAARLGDGGDEVLGMWVDMAYGPLGARLYAQHVWTGTELVILGGFTDLDDHGDFAAMREGWLDDGATYNPATDAWRRIPDPPDGAAGMLPLWTGDEVVVAIWEGPAFEDGEVSGPGTAALHAWTPGTDAWRALAPPQEPGHDIHWAATVGGDLVVATGSWDDWVDHPGWTFWAHQDGSDWARLPDVPLAHPAALADLDGDLLVAGSDDQRPRMVVLDPGDRGDVTVQVDTPLGLLAVPLEQPQQAHMRPHPAGPWRAISDELGPSLQGAVIEWVDDRLVVWGGRHRDSGEVRGTGELWLPDPAAP